MAFIRLFQMGGTAIGGTLLTHGASSFINSQKNESIYNDSDNHRRTFHEHLENPSVIKDANPVTLGVVKQMSYAMQREGVPMTQDHCTKAIASIRKGHGPKDFLATENPDVLSARKTHPLSFSKPFYSAGSLAHGAIFSTFTPPKTPNSQNNT